MVRVVAKLKPSMISAGDDENADSDPGGPVFDLGSMLCAGLAQFLVELHVGFDMFDELVGMGGNLCQRRPGVLEAIGPGDRQGVADLLVEVCGGLALLVEQALVLGVADEAFVALQLLVNPGLTVDDGLFDFGLVFGAGQSMPIDPHPQAAKLRDDLVQDLDAGHHVDVAEVRFFIHLVHLYVVDGGQHEQTHERCSDQEIQALRDGHFSSS
jgi:hypothetical protein